MIITVTNIYHIGRVVKRKMAPACLFHFRNKNHFPVDRGLTRNMLRRAVHR